MRVPVRPEGWSEEHRFLALRYEKKKDRLTEDYKTEQYPLFDTAEYSYRVFATNMTGGIAWLTWFYNQRAGAENKEAKKRRRNGGPSLRPVGDELHLVSTRPAGVQPQL